MLHVKRTLGTLILLILLISCGKENTNNFTLQGSVKGLKKGILYLQKDGDSSIINLDSVEISGEPNFVLQTNIKEPILLYLKLFKNDGEEHYIPFFANEGVTEINTTLKNFSFDAKIKGSKQQKLLDEYLDIMSQFNNQNLDLIEATLYAQKNNDSKLIDSLNRKSNNLIKRKYSYTIQYALNNKNSEIAPYLALYEIPSANPKFIDSIYNGLTEKIKNSFYGKKLKDIIEQRNLDSIE